ncbi:hypothetical protein [Amycolatopsis sp. GM8]|uniref:hypothetical protein n=1 Tax=Amycolatopsis sp. GM8 TaxID=2896530 RepID=UPI001F37BC72|nr:hypothetical protein [Amycolatopsis sp. GM8]
MWWEGPRFLDEVMVGSYRARMRELIATALRSPDVLHIEEFEVLHQRTGRNMPMRMIGRQVPDDAGPVRWLQGVTHPIRRLTPGRPRVQSLELITAAFANAGDPLGVIDPEYRQIWMTSNDFGHQLGIALPDDRSLVAMCHPDDMPILHQLITDGSATPASSPIGPRRVRMLGRDGSWRIIDLTASGVRLDGETHVLARFRPFT